MDELRTCVVVVYWMGCFGCRPTNCNGWGVLSVVVGRCGLFSSGKLTHFSKSCQKIHRLFAVYLFPLPCCALYPLSARPFPYLFPFALLSLHCRAQRTRGRLRTAPIRGRPTATSGSCRLGFESLLCSFRVLRFLFLVFSVFRGR